MFNKVTTLTEFILQEERRFKKATGSFTLLLTQIENAAKIIASHIKKTGLVDIISHTGEKNIYQEEVKKIDRFSNDLLIDTLSASGQLFAAASEEMETAVFIKKNRGDYIVFLDPLDGSSNIDANINVGTIFSIYHQNGDLLQPGSKQVAAGYILYGSSVMFVYSCGHGVNGFTLDPSIGSFLLSHPQITIPQQASIYSINEGSSLLWNTADKNYINYLKNSDKKTGRPYKLRYIGSMVADVHRTLLKGGIFLYPQDAKNKEGKLRLMFEINPLSYLILQAGGLAVSNKKNPLTIIPQKIHQKVPIALGSALDIKKYISFLI